MWWTSTLMMAGLEQTEGRYLLPLYWKALLIISLSKGNRAEYAGYFILTGACNVF